MSQIAFELSETLAAAVERAAPSVVQVHGHRRPAAGVVFADNLVAAPARALGDDAAVIRLATGETIEGQVLGHAAGTGLGVVRAEHPKLVAAETAAEPRVGSLAIAIGRTWSGGVIASVTNVAVVGGPLRTGRASEIARVIRIAQPPHGAFVGGALADVNGRVLGLLTGSAIRGTTIAIPATLAWEAAHQIVQRGGTRQGFLGISTIPVTLPARQRGEHAQEGGLLVTGIGTQSPAETAGLLVGDVLVSFAGQPIEEPDALLTALRGDHVGKQVTLSVIRGVTRQDLTVIVGERPSHRAR